MTVHFIILIAYSLLMVGVGLWIGRLVRTGSDFFVAGRGLSPALLFSTFLAANIGAGSTVNATALAYREGVSAWWWNGSAGLGSLVLAFWIGPRIWRLAKAKQYLTVGDFLEDRFGRGVPGLVAVLIWLGTLSILAAQLIGVAAVLAVVGGVPPAVGYVIGAAVMTTYFIAGGLLSSAWVNRVQLVVLLAGFLLALPFAVESAGGVSALTSASGATTFDFWHSSGAGSGWTWLVVLGPAFIVSPGLLQKAYGARDERAIRWGIGATAVALLLFAFVPVLFGMAAAARFPGLERPDLALPTILSDGVPPALGALALAAVFSAEVSSADAVLFMLSTSASRDLYRGFVNPRATDAQVLRVARWAAVAGGAAGVGLSFAYTSIAGALTTFYSLLTVTLFVPVLGGLFVARAGRREALGAILVGVPVLLWIHLTTGGIGYGLWTPTLVGLAAAAAGFGGALATRRAGRRSA